MSGIFIEGRSRGVHLIVLAALALAGSRGTAAAQPRVFDVTAAHGVTSGRPAGPSTTFSPDANPIYVWFRHEGCAGSTITSDWFYLGTDPALRITQGRLVVEGSADTGQFSFELGPGKRWPLGEYRVELRINGTPAAETRFHVAESAAPAYVHVGVGYGFVPPSGWRLDDQVESADVRLTRADGNALMEIVSGPVSVRLDPVSYAAGWESVSVGSSHRLKSKQAGHATACAGEIAYSGVYRGDGVLVKVLFVGTPERFWVITGVFPANEFAGGEATFDRMVASLVLKP